MSFSMTGVSRGDSPFKIAFALSASFLSRGLRLRRWQQLKSRLRPLKSVEFEQLKQQQLFFFGPPKNLKGSKLQIIDFEASV